MSKNAASTEESVRVAAFDAAEFLDSEEVIAEYLTAARGDSNPDVLVRAIANVSRARPKIAKSASK